MSDRLLSSQPPGPMGQAATDLCTFCPRLCSHTCPVSLHSSRETLTPQAKMATLGRLRERLAHAAPSEADPGPGTAPLSFAAAAPIYGCTGCGACTNPCLYKVEPARELLRGRADAEHAALGHPALADLARRHERRALAAADALAQDPELATRRARPGEGAVLPACLPRTQTPDTPEADETLPGPVRDGRAILRLVDRIAEQREARLESSLEPLPPLGIADVTHACAGYALYAAGIVEGFRLYAESFARQVEQYPLLVTSCSACTWLLRVGYPEHGVPLVPRVQHVTELLAPAAELLPIVQPLKRVSYHDPCHLGRRLGVYDEPRRLLERATPESDTPGSGASTGANVALSELAYHHDASRCCGAGGLLPFTEPEIAGAMARARLAEAADVPRANDGEAAVLITACPGCQHHLAESADPRAPGLRVRSLVEVLEEATRPGRPR